MDWLNTPDPYIQYTYEIPEKATQLLKMFTWFFDDYYFYWSPKRRPDIMRRAPLWMHPAKKCPSEKYRPRQPQAQKTLC